MWFMYDLHMIYVDMLDNNRNLTWHQSTCYFRVCRPGSWDCNKIHMVHFSCILWELYKLKTAIFLLLGILLLYWVTTFAIPCYIAKFLIKMLIICYTILFWDTRYIKQPPLWHCVANDVERDSQVHGQPYS